MTGPSPSIVAEAEEFVLGQLYDDFLEIESLAISAREAARRGDREEIRLRLRHQLRDVFRHAVALDDLLSKQGSPGAEKHREAA